MASDRPPSDWTKRRNNSQQRRDSTDKFSLDQSQMISMPPSANAAIPNLGPGWPRLGLIAALMLAVAGLDVLAGSQISPWALYLLPIGIGAASYGGRAGLALTCLTAALLTLAAVLAGHPYASWPFFAISIANRSICLLTVALLVAYVRRVPRPPDSVSGTGIVNY